MSHDLFFVGVGLAILNLPQDLGVASPNAALLFCWPKRVSRKRPSLAAGMADPSWLPSYKRVAVILRSATALSIAVDPAWVYGRTRTTLRTV